MKLKTQIVYTLALTAAVAIWSSGCGGEAKKSGPPKTGPAAGSVQKEPGTHEEHAGGKHEEAGHAAGEHKEAGHHEGEHKEAAHKEGGHAEKHEHAKVQAEGHGHSAEDVKAMVDKLASYADAMHEIEEHREHIEHLIEGGKLADVHPPAEVISMIAKRLPELAKKSGIPHEHWKDINTQSRDLANMFDEIDEAADAGKKPETEAAFAKMVKLIDGLKAHAKHQDKGEQDEKK